MDHQDWNTIVIRKKKEDKKESKKNNNSEFSKLKSIEKKAEEDNLKHKKISSELKTDIQKARCLNKLTQKELANRVNLPLQIISEIESGKAIYNHQHINKIKRFLKMR